jgi:hypothetical protein
VWAELPSYVPPIDRKVAQSDAAARNFRAAHKRGVASELRLLLAAYKPQLSGRPQHAVQPALLRWLLGLTACSFDEGVANSAFELLSLLLAKLDGGAASAGERWPQLSLIAEYINVYGTTSALPTQTSEVVMQRYRSEPLSARAAATTASGALAANPSPARAPVRKRRRREIEVPGVGDEVKVGFKQGRGGELQFFDGEVVKTATEGSVPTGASVFSCEGTTYGPRERYADACAQGDCSSDLPGDVHCASATNRRLAAQEFIVYFSSDDEYWRLDAETNKKTFKISKRKASKKSRRPQPKPAQEQPASASECKDGAAAICDDDRGDSCMSFDGDQMFPVANLRLLFMLTSEVVRRSGYLPTERPIALGLIGLCAMVAVRHPLLLFRFYTPHCTIRLG